MNAAAIRVLFDYNAWAHAQVWQCVQTMSDEQFVQEIDYSLGSVRNHLVHVASVDAGWFSRVRGANRRPDVLKPEEFPTREDVSRLWSVVYSDLDVVLANLEDDTIFKMIDYTAYEREQSSPAWQLLLHVVNHGTDHRAQIMYTLHKLGFKTAEQDFVYYLRDEMPPRGLVNVSADILRDILKYDIYATSRLVSECMAVLQDEQLDQQLGYAHDTVRAQLAHMLMGMQYWIGRAFDVEIDGNVTAIFSSAHDLLANVTDKELMMPVEYKTSRGNDAANMRWEMLWHMINHGTDHRAQTLAMLHELGAPTFQQDLMMYFWDYHLADS